MQKPSPAMADVDSRLEELGLPIAARHLRCRADAAWGLFPGNCATGVLLCPEGDSMQVLPSAPRPAYWRPSRLGTAALRLASRRAQRRKPKCLLACPHSCPALAQEPCTLPYPGSHPAASLPVSESANSRDLMHRRAARQAWLGRSRAPSLCRPA